MIDSTFKNANILVVDDQEANVDILIGLLEIQGYTNVKSTTDSRLVVSLFKSFNPDLILLDLMMPHLSGYEIMEQLESLIPRDIYLPILVLTADISLEAKQRALASGAKDFLSKPFDLVEVGLRIDNLLFARYLHQQLLNQNQILEDRVHERTFELQKKNIELSAAKEKAEASDLLKSAFINNISHEIRTPLNGILGFGQILTEEGLEEADKDMYLGMLNSSSRRLINTVTNFLDISLLSSGNQKVFKREVNPGSVSKEVVNQFRDSCKAKNIEIAIESPALENGFKLYTDGELLNKILLQLIDNAVKFTHHGCITAGYTLENRNIQFFVKDTGIGISEEYNNQIFGNFMQEDPTSTRGFEGSGLGLSIAKGFTELLGGKMWLDSQKGKGSTFYFSLPCVECTTQSNLKNDTRSSDQRQTILIAEDDDINFYYFKALLTHDLIEILHAKNGIEAVQICKEHPEIELVLMDLKMRDMDGFEATSQIKSFRSELPIIAITAYCESEDKKMALQAGCDEFITKPVKKDFLLKKLEEFGLIVINS
jgi:two-component system sensor histidine kinase/response regulator